MKIKNIFDNKRKGNGGTDGTLNTISSNLANGATIRSWNSL